MLKRENRFLGKFQTKTRSVATPLFSAKYSESGGSSKRLAFVVAKKVDKRAVVRNRVKRLFRSSAQELLGDIKSLDIIFYVKKEALSKSRDEILSAMKGTLLKNNLLDK